MNGFDFTSFAQTAGRWLDGAGVVIILSGAILSTLLAVIHIFEQHGVHNIYRMYRHNLARSILVGLEFLVAGDIIRSVTGTLEFEGVATLGLIVVIRSLLGIEFEMEIAGHWPWNRSKSKKSEEV